MLVRGAPGSVRAGLTEDGEADGPDRCVPVPALPESGAVAARSADVTGARRTGTLDAGEGDEELPVDGTVRAGRAVGADDAGPVDRVGARFGDAAGFAMGARLLGAVVLGPDERVAGLLVDFESFEAEGLDEEGLDDEPFDEEGLDDEPFDEEGLDDEPFDEDGLDDEPFDEEGLDDEPFEPLDAVDPPDFFLWAATGASVAASASGTGPSESSTTSGMRARRGIGPSWAGSSVARARTHRGRMHSNRDRIAGHLPNACAPVGIPRGRSDGAVLRAA